ncbi:MULTISPECIES: CarD family transcriptional regulator [unclassified Candidatus Lariskella]|uniref:CarD family transcriptional regulator n=1 Tax=unclassified Candidatus Lariskella TaxID=2632605 RepID=UPI0030D06AB0
MKTSETKVFRIGDPVIYPTHGVGQITGEEVELIGGIETKLYVISFAKDKMVLRVPKSRALKTGLRHLSSEKDFANVISVLRSAAKMNKNMWSKRAQEYEQKINSGDIKLIAEVVRDLYRQISDQERSYSEKLIYDAALDRLAREYAVASGMELDVAKEKIISILQDYRIAE